MNICTITAIAIVMAQPTSWSRDGSAEAAALRARAETQAAAEGGASDNTRGMEYRVDPAEPSPAPAPEPAPGVIDIGPPPAELPADDVTNFDANDFHRNYELEKIAKRGRSFFVPGVVLSTLGTIMVLGAIGGIATEVNPITGGLLGGSVALAAIGWPLLVVGVRMRKHPEKYVKDRRTAAVSPGGFTLRF